MFTKLFAGALFGKLLDFLADHPDSDYTVAQLHEFTGIKVPTLRRIIRELKEERIIVYTRRVGRSKYYRLNADDPHVVSLLKTARDFINEELASVQFDVKRAKGFNRESWRNN
jgi:DNA-binding transcriptional ArsR family regulator